MKNFVLDTNVILHDSKSIYNFQENNIFLPIVVLEELDKFKKGDEQINFNSRDFIRSLDSITDNSLFSEGAPLGEGLGRLYIQINNQYRGDITNIFPERTPDHRILSITKTVMVQNPDNATVLVTKDINLRMKARALGIATEDYYSDKVKSVDLFESDAKIIEINDPHLIAKLYKTPLGLSPSELKIEEELIANECFTLRAGESTILCRYNSPDNIVTQVIKEENSGIRPRNAEQAYAFDLLNDPDIKLVAITGRAGTGKTLIALASALKQTFLYKQIYLMRPVVALSNKDLGFLPGNEKEKIAPYMEPLFDNLNVIKYQAGAEISQIIDDMQSSGQLKIEALAYIRGRSLSECICIIDEAQNLTPHEIKTIITRAGEGTKMIFTGDIHQIDSPYLDTQSNGLSYMIDKMKGDAIFAHINLLKGERSELAEIASHKL